MRHKMNDLIEREFNRGMSALFERTGEKSLELIHGIASSKSTLILYQHFLSGPIMLTDIVEQGILSEPTVYRAAKKLRMLGLIELLKKEPTRRGSSLGGPRKNIWKLKTMLGG